MQRRQLRILTATFYHYYGNARGIEPSFYYLYKVPQAMEHDVDFFDYRTATEIGHEQMQRLFLNLLKGGKYDATFIATYGDDFTKDTLQQAKEHTTTFGWNSDDEWRWDDYSQDYVNDYTFMVTNDPDVYSANRAKHPNLLHAQWACTGLWDGRDTKKDIGFSFVGQVYGTRNGQIRYLSRRAGLRAFGMGSGTSPVGLDDGESVLSKATAKDRLRRYLWPVVAKLLPPHTFNDTISFETVNRLWNRSKISFTPLDSSRGNVKQIKSRVFDMGLSGTLMLAPEVPHLNDYYEPGKEYIPFETLEDCAEKATFYLRNESERRKIANAYLQRTVQEHMWKDRIAHVLRSAGW